MSELCIETRSLSKCFGEKLALKHFSLELPRGGVHALVGSNGAGKSTLFRLLLGMIAPSAGSSSVLGHDSQALRPEIRGKIGLVGEEHTLPGWIPVSALKAMHQSLYSRWNDALYKEVLGHFDVLPSQRVSQLSRGERAGVNLALILAQGPELLFLDEPTLGLDVVAKQRVLESLLDFADRNDDCTIVYCSHQMDEIERVADSLLVLERGELTHHSPLDDFCGRISQWSVDGSEVPFDIRSIPGLLKAKTIEHQQHMVVIDQDETFGTYLLSLGAQNVHSIPISFDRAVNAYLTRNHAAPVA